MLSSGNSPQVSAATAAADFFSQTASVEAVLLVGSWAHGRADTASDIDIVLLVSPQTRATEREEILASWEQAAPRQQSAELLGPLVRYSDIEVSVVDGEFSPQPRGWTSGPDDFELRLGNYVAYSRPLFERTGRYHDLRDQWLPFYDEKVRTERLQAARTFFLNNVDHIGWSLGRADSFHAFERLYHAHHEFLQALFISRRIYPIAYDKWVTAQLTDLLGMPDIASDLARIIGVGNLNPSALAARATELQRLFDDQIHVP